MFTLWADPGDVQVKVWSRLIPGIAGSIAAEDMDVRLLYSFCVVCLAAPVTSWSLVQRDVPNGCV